MADPISTTIKELAIYLQGILGIKNIYPFESRGTGPAVILIPYGGSGQTFQNQDYSVFRVQAYCMEGSHEKSHRLAWDIKEAVLQIVDNSTDFTNRVHFIQGLDQPGPIYKNENGSFWTTINFEITLVL